MQLDEQTDTTLDLAVTRELSNAVSAAHLFVYLIPESAREAAALGVTDRSSAYFALRSAALGQVPWQVVSAAFYNFNPQLVATAFGNGQVRAPERWQAARFRAVEQALGRVSLTNHEWVDEARSLLDVVLSNADFAGKTMAAANAAVPLPPQPVVALWQQITMAREWRGDAHITVLATHDVGPCECNVLHAATGRLPVAVIRATRGWSDHQWTQATRRLASRGWLDDQGVVTATGTLAREQIELETDEHCVALWAPLEDDGRRRLASLIAPIHGAFAAAGTFQSIQ